VTIARIVTRRCRRARRGRRADSKIPPRAIHERARDLGAGPDRSTAIDLEQLKRNWETFGREDPLWAVLTDPERRGGRWELDEFLATGEDEVQAVFDELAALDVPVGRMRALDFGCGVGRLTQALADRFDRCDGVDIADSMIAEAERINRRGDRVGYHVNSRPDLTLFESETFDFVLSFIALQHMEPRYASRYIAEFIRVLRPGGITIFQLPTGRYLAPITPLADGAWRATITRLRTRVVPAAASSAGSAEVDADTQRPVMEMHGIPPEQLRDALIAAGGEVVAQFDDQRGGPQVEGYRYVVRRVATRTPPLPRPSVGYLDASLAEIPDRPDMFPPVITRRSGIAARLELSVRRKLGRGLRPFTWVQAQHNRAVVEALHHIRDALAEQDVELHRLDQELAPRRPGPLEDGDADKHA
jgi:SAM-dependent methyltransferase